jgi:hypothetical protein
MYIIEFGRGKDKKKRKKRGSLLRKAGIVVGSAGLGAVGVLGASRGIRKRNVQLAKDVGDTAKQRLYERNKEVFVKEMKDLSSVKFQNQKLNDTIRRAAEARVDAAQKRTQAGYDLIDKFPKKLKQRERATYGGVGAAIGGGAALSAVSIGTKEERAAAKRKRTVNNIRSKAGIPEIKRRKTN